MSAPIPPRHPLRRLFAALTEQAFMNSFGLADPKLIDYLTELLVRFAHVDTIWRLRSAQGRRLEEVAEMMAEAESEGRSVDSTREINRHIGDFTLFWTGPYPDALRYLRAPLCKDPLLDYHQQGKRAYWIASQYDDERYREEAPVLRKLSERFELCAFGLSQVRRDWERMDPPRADALGGKLIC